MVRTTMWHEVVACGVPACYVAYRGAAELKDQLGRCHCKAEIGRINTDACPLSLMSAVLVTLLQSPGHGPLTYSAVKPHACSTQGQPLKYGQLASPPWQPQEVAAEAPSWRCTEAEHELPASLN